YSRTSSFRFHQHNQNPSGLKTVSPSESSFMKRYVLCVRIPLALAIAALLGMGLFAKRGWMDWRRMVRHNAELSRQIDSAKAQRDELDRQIKALERSAFAQEQAVRQHLGYLRKDELIIERP